MKTKTQYLDEELERDGLGAIDPMKIPSILRAMANHSNEAYLDGLRDGREIEKHGTVNWID